MGLDLLGRRDAGGMTGTKQQKEGAAVAAPFDMPRDYSPATVIRPWP